MWLSYLVNGKSAMFSFFFFFSSGGAQRSHFRIFKGTIGGGVFYLNKDDRLAIEAKDGTQQRLGTIQTQIMQLNSRPWSQAVLNSHIPQQKQAKGSISGQFY